MKSANKWMAYFTWSLAVLFLFYEFFIRVFPTVMVQNLMESFSVTASNLGVLSACFFYAYAPMQIPVGLLMDYFGPRKLLTGASLLCGIGSFLFGLAQGLVMASIGRFLMGIGSACAFVGMVYVCSHMFSHKKRALLVGIGNSLGMLGAVGATGPLTYSVNSFGWRATVNSFGFIGVFLAVVLYFFIRKQRESHRSTTKQASTTLFRNLKMVCMNYKIWLNGVIALLTYMTTTAFASLWGIPFLMQSYGFSQELAGFIISMIFVGWIVGGPIVGMVSDRCNRRKPFLYICIILTIFTLLPVLYISHLPISLLFVLLFFVGFFQSGELLNFSLAIEFNPIELKGMSIAFTNFLIASGSSIVQPLIGRFLDWGWDKSFQGGVPIYSLHNYHIALLTLPVTLVLALILLLFLQEKCKLMCCKTDISS